MHVRDRAHQLLSVCFMTRSSSIIATELRLLGSWYGFSEFAVQRHCIAGTFVARWWLSAHTNAPGASQRCTDESDAAAVGSKEGNAPRISRNLVNATVGNSERDRSRSARTNSALRLHDIDP